MPNVSEMLVKAAAVLETSGVTEARREAASLLAFALQKDKIFLVAHSEYELSAAEEKRFEDIIERRAGREPFQYIVGKQEFYGLDFAVTKDVLIPRPETEMIVENAIEFLQNKTNPIFCEVGIGSGCIAVSILHSIKKARAVGLDVSENALAIARQNAETHRTLERIELKISDVYEKLAANEKFDLIVSNPPYIPSSDIENLQAEVRDFEPLTALTDGSDGISIIKKIIKDAPRFLKNEGLLLMEIGIHQADEIKCLFEKKIWRELDVLPDFQNIPRMVRARINIKI